MLKTQQRITSKRHFLMDKLIRMFWVQMITKECNQLIWYKLMHMQQENILYVRKKIKL